jgi:hypothetical protein
LSIKVQQAIFLLASLFALIFWLTEDRLKKTADSSTGGSMACFFFDVRPAEADVPRSLHLNLFPNLLMLAARLKPVSGCFLETGSRLPFSDG